MAYHPDDTIAAIGTAAGGAARGMVRISGPAAVACVAKSFVTCEGQPDLQSIQLACVFAGNFSSDSEQEPQSIPCDAYLWPKQRSYTRQPTVELHTFGSPPLLESILQTLCKHGARVAEPGEFTLRSFLAGRIDLTQAEAVLGVIDATGEDELRQSLAQLAGGLSKPLGQLRERLLSLLAELEAGLDFADEDIEFISRENLRAQLVESQEIVDGAIHQLATRGKPCQLPRVVLVGKPNVGKSSLFNALVESFGVDEHRSTAIVSNQPGTTRDYVTAHIRLGNFECELVDTAGDTAGDDFRESSNQIDQAAQTATSEQAKHSTLRVRCIEASDPTSADRGNAHLLLHTKSDLGSDSAQPLLTCSSLTGEGLAELAQHLAALLAESIGSGAAALTSARCAESLRLTYLALQRSLALVDQAGGEELIAAEIREGLQYLGHVVGTIVTDDILDRIFRQFCIGK